MSNPYLSSSSPAAGPTHVRWQVFALACSTSWLLYLHRYAFALFKPELQTEFGLSNEDLGALDSAFSFCYMIFQIPLGIVADVLGVHLVLSSLIAIWTIGLLLHALAPTIGVMRLARALLGIGQSATYACLSRISKTWFPAANRTSLQGWVGVFFGRIGGLSANLLFATLLMGWMGWDWRTALYLFVALGAGQAVMFAAVFRNSPLTHPRVNEAEAELIVAGDPPAAKRMSLRTMWRRLSPRSVVNLLAVNVQTILSTVADNIYSSWIPLFLFQIHSLDKGALGIYSALPLLGGAIGGAVGGTLNDILIRRFGSRRWARRAVGVGGKVMAAGVLLLALQWFDQPFVFCGILFFVKVFSDSGLATTWGAVTDIGGRATASVFAFNNAVATIGSVVAPLLYGTLSQSEDARGWKLVFFTAAACYVLCGLSWLLIDTTIPLVREGEDE